MSYITQDQIAALIPMPKLVDALDDNGDGVIDLIDPDNPQSLTVLGQIMANASNEVDGFLQGRYSTPFADPPAVVVQATLMFACEAIYARREVGDDKNPFSPKARIYRGSNSTPGILTKIANRELPLDASEGEQITPGAILCEEAPLNASFR